MVENIPDQLTALQGQITTMQAFLNTTTGANKLINSKLDAIAAAISALQIPAPSAGPDLTALTAQVASLTTILTPAANSIQEISTATPVQGAKMP